LAKLASSTFTEKGGAGMEGSLKLSSFFRVPKGNIYFDN
jgi:hypothetical protein